MKEPINNFEKKYKIILKIISQNKDFEKNAVPLKVH